MQAGHRTPSSVGGVNCRQSCGLREVHDMKRSWEVEGRASRRLALGSVSLFSANAASPCLREMQEGHMLPPLAPWKTSGAMWAAREEKRVAWGHPVCGSMARTWLRLDWIIRPSAPIVSGLKPHWCEAARLDHEAQSSYCVWLKLRDSSWSRGKLQRLPPWHATLALRGLQGAAATDDDDDDDEEFPVLALCCLKIRFFDSNLVVCTYMVVVG